MHDDGWEQRPKSQGLLQPGRFLWARALPWSVALGIALWITYKFVQGVGIGLGLGGTGVPTGLSVLAALATGVYAITGPTAADALEPLGDSLEGAMEELIFRGAIFRLLWSVFRVSWALGLSSALFGAMHLVKAGADLMAVLGIIFGGGIPLAALYVLTSRLWASIGYHIAWNFTEAYVFGAYVSGSEFGSSLYRVRSVDGVSTLWSGGAFGPEASIATVVTGLLVGAALLAFAKRRP